MWLIAKTFFGNIFGNSTFIFIAIIVGIAALIIIPNSSAVLERFGFETRASLKAKNANLTSALDQTVQVNEQNAKTEEIKGKIDDVVKESGDAVSTYVATREVKTTVSERKHEQAIQKARSAPQKTQATHHPNLPSPAVIEAVSQANIDMLWDVYKDINPV